MVLTVGKTQFNSEALGAYTEETFREAFKGKVDLEVACKEFKNYFKNVQEPKKSSGKRKKTKSKDNISDSL